MSVDEFNKKMENFHKADKSLVGFGDKLYGFFIGKNKGTICLTVRVDGKETIISVEEILRLKEENDRLNKRLK